MKKNKKTIMYNLLLVTAFILLPQTGFCDEKEESISRKVLGLKGPVVVVVEKECQFEKAFGEIKRTGSKDVRKCFYSNGKLDKQIYTPNSFKKYDYDKYGNLIRKIAIDCNNSDNNDTVSIYNYKYEYNSKGKMINKKDIGIYGSNAKEFVYDYNSYGKISETKVFDISDGSKKQINRLVYSYTNGGKKITTYSEKGLEKEDVFNGSNRIISSRENKGVYWDVKNFKYENSGRTMKCENILESRLNGKKEKLISVIINYDSNGNEIKLSQYKFGENKPFFVCITKYTYDSHGNWTKRLSYINNNLTSWYEREYIYAKNENDYKKYNQDDLSIFF